VKKNKRSPAQNKQYTVAQLLEKAESCIETYQFELAQKFYERALEREPENTEIMNMLGELLVDMGLTDRAKVLFEKSVSLDPNSPSTYMSLGQLLTGEDSISYFRKGIEIMTKQKEGLKISNPVVLELDAQISAAYCALAEVYLTDACYNEDAELQCEKAILNALQHTPNSPEVYYLLASFRISQQKTEEALDAIKRSYSFWQNIDPSQDPTDQDTDENVDLLLPSYELRFNTAKLFVELEQFQTALEIFEVLVTDDDSVPEVWHSMALAFQGCKEFQESKECLTTALQLANLDEDKNTAVIENITTLLSKIEEEIKKLPENMDSIEQELDTDKMQVTDDDSGED